MDQFLDTLNTLINDSDLSVVEIVGALALAQQRVAFDAFVEADLEDENDLLGEDEDETEF